MVKCESATMADSSEPTPGRASDLHFYREKDEVSSRLDSDVPVSSQSVGEREERLARLQDRAAWVTLAAASIPLFLALLGPSQATEEKVQVDVTVVVVENHVAVNPEYAVKAQIEEEMAK